MRWLACLAMIATVANVCCGARSGVLLFAADLPGDASAERFDNIDGQAQLDDGGDPDADSDAGIPVCRAEEVSIAGVIDGRAVSLQGSTLYEFGWTSLFFELGVDFSASVESGYQEPWAGVIRLASPIHIAENASGEMSGWLRFPADASSPVYCIGSLVDRGDALDFDFTSSSLDELGRCPGAPVLGEVTACTLSSELCEGLTEDELVSTVAGAEFVEHVTGSLMVGSPGAVMKPPLVYVQLDSDAHAAIVQLWLEGGDVVEGVLAVPSGADEGALYCIGPGSAVTPDAAGRGAMMVLRNLSRLGKCVPGKPPAGRLAGCVRG